MRKYGEVFAAWRDEWTSDTDLYRAERALRFLKAAIPLSKFLNKISNFNHLSWYVHLALFIATRQMFAKGNTWRFATAAIESRGARIKRVGRAVTNWRSLSKGLVEYSYMDRRTGEKKERKIPIGACALLFINY